MRDILRKHHISFINAFAGLTWAFKTQPNFRIHVTLAIIALVGGIYLGISNIEMTIIVFTIVLGLAGEMINTAIESVTDLVTTQWHKEAKIAKDVSAGMMLLIAIGAVIVASFIFGQYL